MSYDLPAFSAIALLLPTILLLTALFELRSLVMAYSWQGGILVHWRTAAHISRQDRVIINLNHQITYQQQVPLEKEATGQLRFGVYSDENHRLKVIKYDIAGKNGDILHYQQVWNIEDWLKKMSNKWIWTEQKRNHRGKRLYHYLWVREEDFDPKRDTDLLEIIHPVLDYDYIEPPNKYLPYEWEFIGVTDHA